MGKRIHINRFDPREDNMPIQIVGVVAHVNQWGLDSDQSKPLRAQIYLPCLQMPDNYIANVPSGGRSHVLPGFLLSASRNCWSTPVRIPCGSAP